MKERFFCGLPSTIHLGIRVWLLGLRLPFFASARYNWAMEKETLKGPKLEAPKTPPPKSEVRGETIFVGKGEPIEEKKPKVEKKAVKEPISKESFTPASKEALDKFQQKLKQQVDSKLVRTIKERAQPQDQRVVKVLNELLDTDETDALYPYRVEGAARKLASIVKQFETIDVSAQVAQDARRCLRQLVQAYPEYPQLEQIMLGAAPEILGGAGPTSPAVEALFDASGTDPEITNPELAKKMENIQNRLRSLIAGNPLLHNTHLVERLREEISDGAEKGKWDWTQATIANTRLQGVIDETEVAKMEERGEFEQFSTIYLNPDERKLLLINPEKAIEDYLRRLEESVLWAGEDLITQGFEHEIQLAGQYFIHPQYIRDTVIEAKRNYIRTDKDKPDLIINRKDVTEDEYVAIKNPKNDPQKDQNLRKEYKDKGTMLTLDRGQGEDYEKKYVDIKQKEAQRVSRELAEKVRNRTGIQRAYATIKGLGDAEKAASALSQVGERGLEFVLNENGGLVEIARNNLLRNFKLARFDENGDLRPYSPDIIQQVQEDTIREMLEDRNLYEKKYKGATGRNLEDQDVRAIVNLARYVAVVTQQDLVAMLGGVSPAEMGIGSEETHSLVGTTAEGFLAAMDINRFSIEKYFMYSKHAARRGIWENDCRFAVQASGRDKYVIERFNKYGRNLAGIEDVTSLDKGSEKFELAVKLFGRNILDEKGQKIDKGNLSGAIETIFEYDKNGHKREHPPTSLREVTAEMIKDRMLVVEGERVVGEALAMYDYYSSGWRINEYIKQIKRIYGGDDSSPNDYGQNLGLGLQLKDAGNGLLGVVKETKKPEAENKVAGVLEKIAKYRPQAIFEFLTDERYEDAMNWFKKADNQKLLLEAFGEPITRPDQVYKAISRRFVAINDLLAVRGLPPINYSPNASLSLEQRDVVNEVCGQGGTTANADRYLELMQKMFVYASEERIIGVVEKKDKTTGTVTIPFKRGELHKEIYYGIYRRTQWVDDARLRFLERPEEAFQDYDKRKIIIEKLATGELKRFSHRVAEQGVGPRAPLPRTWVDMASGVRLQKEEFKKTLDPDPKIVKEGLKNIYASVDAYAGPPYGVRAVVFLLSGWAKTMKTDTVLNLLHLGMMENSSAAKRLFGNEALSIGYNQLDKLIDEIGVTVLNSRIENLDPEMASAINGFLGLGTKILGKDVKLQLWAYRIDLYIALIALLLATQAVKSAKEGSEGK